MWFNRLLPDTPYETPDLLKIFLKNTSGGDFSPKVRVYPFLSVPFTAQYPLSLSLIASLLRRLRHGGIALNVFRHARPPTGLAARPLS